MLGREFPIKTYIGPVQYDKGSIFSASIFTLKLNVESSLGEPVISALRNSVTPLELLQKAIYKAQIEVGI